MAYELSEFACPVGQNTGMMASSGSVRQRLIAARILDKSAQFTRAWPCDIAGIDAGPPSFSSASHEKAPVDAGA
jgi:hypothetical protein